MATETWQEPLIELGTADAISRLVQAIDELRSMIGSVDRESKLRYDKLALDIGHLRARADAGATQASLVEFRKAMLGEFAAVNAKIDLLVEATAGGSRR